MAFTYFFRDQQTLDFISDHVLPVLKNRRFITVWDAGCATGPEPYSLAIVLREHMSPFLFRNLRIYATDIDGSNLFGTTIREGFFLPEHLNSVPSAILRKYFTPDGNNGGVRVSEELRNAVTFMKHDLLSYQMIRGGFGLVVCKNVLLHFSEEQRVSVLKMFHDAMDDNGFLVMEQTQKLPGAVRHLFQPLDTRVQVFRKVHATA